MIKKLCIALLSACVVAPVMAQQSRRGGDASFAPKQGQWEVSAVIGNNQMFNQDLNYLLPTYWDGTGDNGFNNPVGLPTQSGDGSWNNQSGDPGIYLNLGSLNSNSLINLIGLQGKYFILDNLDVNLMFSMNINATPSKNYIEGDATVNYLPIQASKFMEGKITNAWNLSIGSNYYFQTKNERINLYAGGLLGWQMGRIETMLPYTGETVTNEDSDGITGGDVTDNGDEVDDPVELYVPSSRAGQIFGLKVAAVGGIEYSLAKGLILGFEVQPIAYRYDCLQICPKGSAAYVAGHHNVNFFASPNLKIGFRF